MESVAEETLKTEIATLLENINKLKECIICFQPIENLQDYPDLNCDHNQFHERCLNTWLNENQTCPICRKHTKNFREESENLSGDDYMYWNPFEDRLHDYYSDDDPYN